MLYFKLGHLLYTYKRISIHTPKLITHIVRHDLDQKYLHYSITTNQVWTSIVENPTKNQAA